MSLSRNSANLAMARMIPAGYIAVSDDEKEINQLGRRDIVVALRGTATYGEWLANLTNILTPTQLNPLNPHENVKVEMGFLRLYTS
jgi:hypothetical protein